MSDKDTKKADSVVIEVTAKDIDIDNDSTASFIPDNAETHEADELTKEEAEKIDKMLSQNEENNSSMEEETSDLAGEAKDLLNKFKNYISGDKLDEKCEEAEKRTGVKKDIIKNAFVKNGLRTIADALNLTISIAGDVVIGAVKFIENIIFNIVNFTTGTLHKLITAVTLNCGSVAY